MTRARPILLLLLCLLPLICHAEDDLSVTLMRSTFRITGMNSRGANFAGTTFLIGKPIPRERGESYYILVTAAHLLDSIVTDTARLDLRTKTSGRYIMDPLLVQIRRDGKPLWVEHPSADVAAMYISIPDGADKPFLSLLLFSNNDILQTYHVQPGDELYCLGFPLGKYGNEAGFAVIRRGTFASYPVTPVEEYPTFLMDFRVFDGNSGGPVFAKLSKRISENGEPQTVTFLAGMVTERSLVPETTASYSGSTQIYHDLGLAIVVQASLIRETVDMLPPEP